MKCPKVEKNAHHNLTWKWRLQMTWFIRLTGKNPEDTSFTIMCEREKQQIVPFEQQMLKCEMIYWLKRLDKKLEEDWWRERKGGVKWEREGVSEKGRESRGWWKREGRKEGGEREGGFFVFCKGGENEGSRKAAKQMIDGCMGRRGGPSQGGWEGRKEEEEEV